MLFNRARLIFHGISVAVQMDNKIYIIVLNIAYDMSIIYSDILVITLILQFVSKYAHIFRVYQHSIQMLKQTPEL